MTACCQQQWGIHTSHRVSRAFTIKTRLNANDLPWANQLMMLNKPLCSHLSDVGKGPSFARFLIQWKKSVLLKNLINASVLLSLIVYLRSATWQLCSFLFKLQLFACPAFVISCPHYTGACSMKASICHELLGLRPHPSLT